MHAISSYRMVTDTQTHAHTHTHTYRQDRLQYTALQLSAQCNNANLYAMASIELDVICYFHAVLDFKPLYSVVM